MEEDSKVNIGSIILFTIFVVLLIVAFFVMRSKNNSITGFIGRYFTNAKIDSDDKDTLTNYNINTNDISYELLLKDNESFVLYINGDSKYYYTGLFTRNLNNYELKVNRIYDDYYKCYNFASITYKFKHHNSTLTTSELTDGEISFIKYDENVSKYDEEIGNIVDKCGNTNGI